MLTSILLDILYLSTFQEELALRLQENRGNKWIIQLKFLK